MKTTRRKLNNKRKICVVKVSFSQHFSFVRYKMRKDAWLPPSTSTLEHIHWIYTMYSVCTMSIKIQFFDYVEVKKRATVISPFFLLHFYNEHNKKDKRLVKRQFHLMLYNSMCHNSQQNRKAEREREKKLLLSLYER